MARKFMTQTGAADVGDRSPKNANRSVGVGLGVLKAIANLGRAGSLSEIARAARMPASRTHRFLAGMIQVGAVQQDPVSGYYDLGPLMVHLGVAALGRVDGVKMGTEALRVLTQETGLVSVLVIWGAGGPMVIRWEQGELPTAVRIREGRILPLLRTASGKIFMTYLPDGKSRPLAEKELASPEHRASLSKLTTMEDVARLKQQILTTRLADNLGESEAGISGLSAPVFGADGEIAMAIGVIGVLGIAKICFDGPAAQRLQETADNLTRGLGGVPRTATTEPAQLQSA
ncbi:MAG: DNA-binding IclR family transcriptional regulator [Alphaproteobacteria bacterium]|jgi:DNA-binding IclR family transcriptional regulator